MGWLRLVGSLKLYVSFAIEPYKRDYILQKRPMILRSLLIVATPYHLEIPSHIYRYILYIHTRTHIYAHIYTYTQVYTYTYIHTQHKRIYIYVHKHTNARKHAQTHHCISKKKSISSHLAIQHVIIRVVHHIHTCIYTDTHMCIYTYVHANAGISIYAQIHRYKNKYIHVFIHVFIHMRVHIFVYIYHQISAYLAIPARPYE